MSFGPSKKNKATAPTSAAANSTNKTSPSSTKLQPVLVAPGLQISLNLLYMIQILSKNEGKIEQKLNERFENIKYILINN